MYALSSLTRLYSLGAKIWTFENIRLIAIGQLFFVCSCWCHKINGYCLKLGTGKFVVAFLLGMEGKIWSKFYMIFSRYIITIYFQIYNPFLYYPDECSLLNVNGPEWKTQRTAVVAAFNAIPAHTVSILSYKMNGSKFNRKMVKIDKNDTHSTHIHKDRVLSWLCTCISIKSCRMKLVLLSQSYPLREW